MAKEEMVTLYKYMSSKHLEETLLNSRLYMDDGSHFNDPFELNVIKNKEVTHIDGLHILCLTNSFQKKLMWSHYSDSHKGVCLTIKVPLSIVYPICYSSKRISSRTNLDKTIQESRKEAKNSKKKFDNKDYSKLTNDQKIAFIKDQKWSYENEYRIVLDNTDCLENEKNKYYLPVTITNIYLGVNYDSTEFTEEMFDYCEKNGITIKQMKLSTKNYSVNPVLYNREAANE